MSKALATKNVAAVLLGLGMMVSAFAFATPASAQTMADLQAQINALLAQIAALQGGGSQQTGGLTCSGTFTQNLRQGASGGEVMAVQKFLNSVDGTQVAVTGAGSPGNETSYFGPATHAAVIKFQNKFAADILTPVGLTAGNGNWYSSTRAKANALCTSAPTTPTNPGPVTGGNLMIGASTQPANSLAPESAARVPFTTFTLTNTSNAAITVTGVTVQRTGLAADAVFSGLVLVDEQGIQLGNSKTLNSNHQAAVGDTFTINAGQTKTLTVAGNMAADNSTRAGQVVGISVVGISTSATVSGSLPIVGASHTVNSTLDIGTLAATVGSTDLNAAQSSQAIGVTGLTGAAIRVTAGSAEEVWVKSIRWNQSGSASASDIANVVTVVDGTSYPTNVSSDGKYYTTVFPGNGIQIGKGLNKELIVRFDTVGGPARTVNFDVYKATDIHAVGATFGYGITTTQSADGTVSDATELTNGSPFFSGSKFTISAGTFTSLARANEVAAQNITLVSPNQPLGGFAMDVKGEGITVGSQVYYFTYSSGAASSNLLTSVSLVDANGAVVAGPVDAVNVGGVNQKVTFSNSVTFPTGRNVYSLKGQVPSTVSNGVTVQASTTPSTDWSNITGQSTGNSISLSSLSTAVTANVMTVRNGAVVLSIAGTPAAQTIVTGGSGVTVSAIQLDATQSGEDVRFNSMKLRYTDGLSGGDVTNCFVYDGVTRLNDTAVNPTADATDYTFTLSTPLVASKGTVKTITVKCDVPSAISSGTFSLGFASTVTFTGTGLASSQTITPTSSTGATQAGNTMTIASGGTLTVAKDSSSPSYAIAAAGTSGVTLGTLRFTGTNEALNLTRVALQMSNVAATSSPNNLTQVTLHDMSRLPGETQVGTAIFAGTRYATSTLTSTVTVPANGFKVLTVKGNLAAIGTGQAGTQGALIQVDYDDADSTGTRATGAQSGSTIDRTSSTDTAVDGVRVFKSYPVFAQIAGGGTLTTATAVVLDSFTVTANASGDVGIYKFTINVATSSASAVSGTTTVTNLKVYAYTSSGSPVSGFTDGQVVATMTGVASGENDAVLSSILQIPAGQTYTFKVVGDTTITAGTGTFSGNVTTKVIGDAAFPALATLMGSATGVDGDTNDDFIWSPNATTTSVAASNDWTNGYGVAGLPSAGLSGTVWSK